MMSCCLLKLQIRILPCFPWVLANFNSLISYCTEHVPNLISTPRSRIHVALLGSILPWCLDFLQVPEDAIPPETAEAPGSFPVASSFRPVKMCRSMMNPLAKACCKIQHDTTMPPGFWNTTSWSCKCKIPLKDFCNSRLLVPIPGTQCLSCEAMASRSCCSCFAAIWAKVAPETCKTMFK